MSTTESTTTTGPGEPHPADTSLAQVMAATTELRRARSMAADAEDEWRFTVGSALEGTQAVQEVAEAAGLTVEQAQELHDDEG
jgi:hypothetical protein